MKKKATKKKATTRKPKSAAQFVGHIHESKPPVSLVALAKRIEDHYGENDFDEVGVEVEVDYNDDEIGEGVTKPEDVTEVKLTLSATPFDSNYFDHQCFSEALWFDVCDVAGWKGDSTDAPFDLCPGHWAEKPKPVPGKVLVRWQHHDEVEITLLWTPATEKGRKHLKMLHEGK